MSASKVRSATAICETTADSSIMMTIWLVSAGKITFSACGSTMVRKTWTGCRPSAIAASDWPSGTASRPAPTISVVYAAMFSVMARIAAATGSRRMPRLGRPKKMKKSWTRKGVLRISST